MNLRRAIDELETLQSADQQMRPLVLPWKPLPRQAVFLSKPQKEVGFGGQTGGSKTSALLLLCLQYAHVPGYSALMLRRTFKQLEGADGPIVKSHELLRGLAAQGRCYYTASKYLWTFPNPLGPPATLRFGHIEHPGDETQYDGDAHATIAVDEATHFLFSMVRYLFSRMRKPDVSKVGDWIEELRAQRMPEHEIAKTIHARRLLAAVPLRMRYATNPGNIGHDWFKARFGLNDDGTQKPQWTEKRKGRDVIITAEQRPFVPSALADNPYVDHASYAEMLEELDETSRLQKQEGRWIRDASGVLYGEFKRGAPPEGNVVPWNRSPWPGGYRTHRGMPPRGWHVVLAIDLGTSEAKKTTAFVVLAYSDTSPVVYVLKSWAESGMDPTSDAERIAQVEATYGEIERVVVDLGGLGKGYQKEFQRRFGERIIGAVKKDKLGFRRLLKGAFGRGHVVLIEGENEELSDELETLPWNAAGLDNEKGFANHFTDALLYGFRDCYGYLAETPESDPEPGTEAWSVKVGDEIEREIAEVIDRQAAIENGSASPWDDM